MLRLEKGADRGEKAPQKQEQKVERRGEAEHQLSNQVHPCSARRLRRQHGRVHGDAGQLDQAARELEHLAGDAEEKSAGCPGRAQLL